ncbi:MAG: hypothetical protein H6621_03015 [Halobacteriovoraceae bacterium]|nr:hypothetical protein [Halobacteriovoraceae bacterium]MCB9094016.1 hypothetical protein [Halobacteriovoraceae bacterium]
MKSMIALSLVTLAFNTFASPRPKKETLLQAPCYIESSVFGGTVGKFLDGLWGDGDGVLTSFCNASIASKFYYDSGRERNISYQTGKASFSYLLCSKKRVTYFEKVDGEKKAVKTQIEYSASQINKEFYAKEVGFNRSYIKEDIFFQSTCESEAKAVYNQIKLLQQGLTEEELKEFVTNSVQNKVIATEE